MYPCTDSDSITVSLIHHTVKLLVLEAGGASAGELLIVYFVYLMPREVVLMRNC